MIRKYITILLVVCTYYAEAQKKYSFSTAKKKIDLSTGITLSFVETGQDERNSVIFLHGYTDTSRSFFPTIDEMHRKNPTLKIYALDLRGHGDSSMPLDKKCAAAPELCFSPVDFSRDIMAFMDQLKIQSAVIVGHSMGSIIAQELAIQHPERVKSMVLIGSTANGTTNSFVHEFLLSLVVNTSWKSYSATQKGTWPENVYNVKPSTIDTAFTNWIKKDWVTEPTADPEFIDTIYPETMQTRLGTWIGVPRALSIVDNRERLKEIKVNTLVLWAMQDLAMPETPDQNDLKISLGSAAAKNRVSFRFKTYGKKPIPPAGTQLNDFGHNLQWGAPHQVAADVLSFIQTGKPTDESYFAGPRE